MSSRCIKKEPNSATFLDTYAWILHLQGQDTLARFYMQQAWDKAEDKTDPEIVEHYQIISVGKKQENTSEEKSSEAKSAESQQTKQE